MSSAGVTSRYGRDFWAWTLIGIPLGLTALLGAANALDVAHQGGTLDGYKGWVWPVSLIAWPLLSGLSVLVIFKLELVRPEGVKRSTAMFQAFGLVMVAGYCWAMPVALVIWTLFPATD